MIGTIMVGGGRINLTMLSWSSDCSTLHSFRAAFEAAMLSHATFLMTTTRFRPLFSWAILSGEIGGGEQGA